MTEARPRKDRPVKHEKTFHLFSTMHWSHADGSQSRCAWKLFKDFGGTTLVDLFAGKFAELAKSKLFQSSWIEVPARPTENALASMLIDHDAPIRRQDKGLFSSLADTEAEFVVWLNASHPFLNPHTVLQAVRLFAGDPEMKAMTTVRTRHNWFWDFKTRLAITHMDPTSTATQDAKPLLESTHLFHIYNRKQLLESGLYWTLSGPKDPYLLEMPGYLEDVDIDTEDDFEKAKAIYVSGRR